MIKHSEDSRKSSYEEHSKLQTKWSSNAKIDANIGSVCNMSLIPH